LLARGLGDGLRGSSQPGRRQPTAQPWPGAWSPGRRPGGGAGGRGEQAKGKLAGRLGLDMDQAFTVLRACARGHNLRLSELAQAFIDGTPADFPGLTTPATPRPG
jgi:hypothetical protein